LPVTVQVVPEPVVDVMLVPARPVFASAKSAVSTPVTLSLNVTVHCTLAAFVGDAPTRAIETTVGTVLSIVITGPVRLPFPTPLPPSLFVAASWIESSSTRLRPTVPSPEPVLTVTV